MTTTKQGRTEHKSSKAVHSKTSGLRFVGRLVSIDHKSKKVTAKFKNGHIRNWPINEDSIERARKMQPGDLISLVYIPAKPIHLHKVPRNPTVTVTRVRSEGCSCHEFDKTGHCMGNCSGKCPPDFPYCVKYPGVGGGCVCSKTP
jgi:hypothetical protein